jgi:hypothetical protein
MIYPRIATVKAQLKRISDSEVFAAQAESMDLVREHVPWMIAALEDIRPEDAKIRFRHDTMSACLLGMKSLAEALKQPAMVKMCERVEADLERINAG